MSIRSAASAYAVIAFFTLFAGEAIRNTFSWYGYAAWAAVVLVGTIVLFAKVVRAQAGLRRAPAARLSHRGEDEGRSGDARLSGQRGVGGRASVVLLGAYVVWAIASLVWSAYPIGTLTGIAAILVVTFVAVTLSLALSWAEIARALHSALVLILGLSLIFEIGVAALLRRPILPTFPIDVVPGEKIPAAFYWSRALLFSGGRIQGIVGNANLLGFIALLAVILGGCLLFAKLGPRWLAITGLSLGALELVLTRSSTVIAAAVVTAVVLLLVLLLRREPNSTVRVRRRVGGGLAALILIGAVVAMIQYRSLLALMGKSDDLTGRFDIWSTVTSLFVQRPVVGWGWIGYWLPWIPPFGDLAERNGVVYLQAHNALLDVAFQIGIVGALFFLALIVAVGIRIGQARMTLTAAEGDRSESIIGVVLPSLLLAALLTQSLAESRLLYEGNWALFCTLAIAGAVPLIQRLPQPAMAEETLAG